MKAPCFIYKVKREGICYNNVNLFFTNMSSPSSHDYCDNERRKKDVKNYRQF